MNVNLYNDTPATFTIRVKQFSKSDYNYRLTTGYVYSYLQVSNSVTADEVTNDEYKDLQIKVWESFYTNLMQFQEVCNFFNIPVVVW